MKFLLFYRMAWSEDRPGLMLAGAGICIVIGLILSYPN